MVRDETQMTKRITTVLEATLQLSKSLTEIKASLRNFKIFDMSSLTLYRKIAECTVHRSVMVLLSLVAMIISFHIALVFFYNE